MQNKFLLQFGYRRVSIGDRHNAQEIMSLLSQAIQLAFPFVEGTNPLVLAPVFALVVSFGLIGVFGAVLTAQEYFRTQNAR